MKLKRNWNKTVLKQFWRAAGDRGFNRSRCTFASRSRCSASVTKQYNSCQHKLGSKQAHRVSRAHGLAASTGAWLRATESEISAVVAPNGSGMLRPCYCGEHNYYNFQGNQYFLKLILQKNMSWRHISRHCRRQRSVMFRDENYFFHIVL